MRTQTRSESSKSSKRPPLAAKKKAKKTAKKAISKTASATRRKAAIKASAAKRSKAKSQLVSHENDLFDEEEDFESPRRNPSQLRPSEFEEEEQPRRLKRSASRRKN